jgi:hypothetical protein
MGNGAMDNARDNNVVIPGRGVGRKEKGEKEKGQKGEKRRREEEKGEKAEKDNGAIKASTRPGLRENISGT